MIGEHKLERFYLPDREPATVLPHELEAAVVNEYTVRQMGRYALNGHNLDASETLIAESLLIDAPRHEANIIHNIFSLSTDRNDTVHEAVEEYVTDQLQELTIAVDQLRQHNEWANDYSDLVLASLAASLKSHAGQVRKNGPRFFSHPASTAVILEAAWNTLPIELQRDNEALLDRLQALGFLHDTFEHALEGDGAPVFAYENFCVTPLLVRRMHQAFHHEAEVNEAGDRLFAITKIQTSTAKMPDSGSVKVITTDAETSVAKSADTHHNHKIDPIDISSGDVTLLKKAQRANARYTANAMLYQQASEQHGEPYKQLIDAIATVKKERITNHPFLSAEL